MVETLTRSANESPVQTPETGIPTNSLSFCSERIVQTSIRIVGNSVDLDLDLSQVKDEQQRDGKMYEEACFREVIKDLDPNEVAYGAHFLNSAFNSHLKARGVSIPDALVGEIDYSTKTPGQSDESIDRSVIKVKRIIEARTGEINGKYKIERFKNLTIEIRRNPDFFKIAIKKLLAGRGGILNPRFIIAPPDSQIEVIFYSPRDHTENDIEYAKSQYKDHCFKDIIFRTVPLPIYTSPEQTS